MLTSKKNMIKPLLESNSGIHLTAYLVNRGSLIFLKSKLRAAIAEARAWLIPALPKDERTKFLEPLEALLEDPRIFRQMKGNIGLFRNKDLFRVLNIPVDVQHSCQVASSFHVKPLLRWLQTDREFLLLGMERNAAHLYFGSQDSLKLVDSILFPEILKEGDCLGGYSALKRSRKKSAKQQESFAWLNDWIEGLTINSKPRLFVAGERNLAERFSQNIRYAHAVKTPVAFAFGNHNLAEICVSVRKFLLRESEISLEKALMEFRFAEEGNRARKNIFQIAKAVVEGRVRKLIVTDDLNIFGRIDARSGELSIHPYDLDHEDDDVLDDMAQMVLNQGGEVVIAKSHEIPKGRPILAILDEPEREFERAEGFQHFEILQERFG